MESIVFATGNSHKVREFNELLLPYTNGKYNIVSMKDAGFTDDIIEDGMTFEDNAIIKAKTVYDSIGGIVVADDSGLCIDALGGRPGIYSSRYGGDITFGEKIDLILKEMNGVPLEKRTARFACAICCYSSSGFFVCQGRCEGLIAESPKGNGSFGYDPIFFYPSAKKTFAEMADEEKNKISHRGIAVNDFIKTFFKMP